MCVPQRICTTCPTTGPPLPLPTAVSPPAPTSFTTATSLSLSLAEVALVGDVEAAVVLANPQSIKEQLERQQRRSSDHPPRTMSLTRMSSSSSSPTVGDKDDGGGIDDIVSQYHSLGFKVGQINGSDATYVRERRSILCGGIAPTSICHWK